MSRRVFWAACWLAIGLVVVKGFHLGVPHVRTWSEGVDYLRSLAAISYIDVVFALVSWGVGRGVLALARRRQVAQGLVVAAVLAFGAFSCLYAVANVIMFGILGGFLTYPLLELIGNVRMLGSSVSATLTPRVVLALVALPLTYVLLVEVSVRLVPAAGLPSRTRRGIAPALLGAWVIFGAASHASVWATRQDRRIADNPQWVLLASWWQVATGGGVAHMPEGFPQADLRDFDSIGARPPAGTVMVRRVSARLPKPLALRRPLNVVVIVLESVAARWTGLGGGTYETTPSLKAEAARALVFDNFYAHIGRSSNSLAAILLSTYPKLDFRDYTEEFEHPALSSLAPLFRDRGYRTAFMMPSDMSWAGWGTFLQGSGFGELRDVHQLECSPPITSWGVEDRCLVNAMIDWVDRDPKRPFFLMGWAHQMHHPYEPTPGIPRLDLLREHTPADYDLDRYLNVLHETDHQIGRFFDAVRSAGLEEDTLIVVVGDHGQAFGYPHDTYMQGRSLYEEDVHVPLMFWMPRRYKAAEHSGTIGGHVDLAPTIAELADIPAPADWQGRSLFDPARVPRAYFYVAEDHFSLGVREGGWKYTFDLREGVEALYDLGRDPTEQHNVAKAEPARCARLRQRLAAWSEANRRQYDRLGAPAPAAALGVPLP